MGAILTAVSTFFAKVLPIVATAAAATGTAAAAGAFEGKEKGLEMPAFGATPDIKKSEEEARKEEMRRRRLQTKTLLTGATGTFGEAGTTKKILLGQ